MFVGTSLLNAGSPSRLFQEAHSFEDAPFCVAGLDIGEKCEYFSRVNKQITLNYSRKMIPSALAPAAAPMGVASAEAAQDLHPREWAMLQTALSNAQHRALMALVHAYAGFQIHNGQFYVVEGRVSPYISITFRTFSNYLTDLQKSWVCWKCCGAARTSTARSPSGA